MFQVYAIYSSKFDEIYIGYSVKAEKRLASHNHEKNKGYTKRYQPWEMVFTEDLDSIAEVMKKRKRIENWKGKGICMAREVKKKFS